MKMALHFHSSIHQRDPVSVALPAARSVVWQRGRHHPRPCGLSRERTFQRQHAPLMFSTATQRESLHGSLLKARDAFPDTGHCAAGTGEQAQRHRIHYSGACQSSTIHLANTAPHPSPETDGKGRGCKLATCFLLYTILHKGLES